MSFCPLLSLSPLLAADSPPPADWPGWRGVNRDGLVPWLPAKLADKPNIVWERRLTGASHAGLAVAGGRLLFADKDAGEENDIIRCLDAQSGKQLWKLVYPAQGKMDYGTAPRATPLVHRDKVYALGAFGDLHCLALADGRTLWRQNILAQFNVVPVTWGMCASPLVVDEKLIVNPGAKEAGLTALDPATGNLLWKGSAGPAAYASFIVAQFGGVRQIVGYDATSLGGWEIASGKRLWSLTPPEKNDFNVPTPVAVEGRLLVATENNGTRLYQFDNQGRINPQPVAASMELVPDTCSPVVVDGRVYGCRGKLVCLDLRDNLKTVWTSEDPVFERDVTLIASRDRLLAATATGELLLIRAGTPKFELISRVRVCEADAEMTAHSALVGTRLFLRDQSVIRCLDLSE